MIWPRTRLARWVCAMTVVVLLTGCYSIDPNDSSNGGSTGQPVMTKKDFILQLAGICAGVNREVGKAKPEAQPGITAEGLERVVAAAVSAAAPPQDRDALNRFVIALLGAATTLRAQQEAKDAANADAESALKDQASAAVGAANQAGMTYGMPDLRYCEEFVDNDGKSTHTSPGQDDHDASVVATPPAAQTYSDAPRVSSTLQIGGPVGGVVASPDGRAVYVAAITVNEIYVVDVASLTVSSRISLPKRPRSLAVTPDGSRIFVVLFGDDGDPVTGKPKGESVMWVDVVTRHPSPPMSLGSDVYGVTVAPDGSRIYCADHDTAKVSVWDVAPTKVNTVEVAPNPHGVAVSSDGAKAYTANHESNLVHVIDAATLTAGRKIEVGRSPHSVVKSPDGTALYVTNYDSNTVSVIDTRTDTVAGEPIAVGAKPQAVAFTGDGARAVVVNNQDDSVSVIDTRARRVVSTVPVGDSPTSVTITRDGTVAFVSNLRSGTVSVVRLVP